MKIDKIEKDAKLLIASDSIYTLTAIFIETFLVAYFLQVTNKNITKISIYYIIVYFLHALGNLFMGKVIKKIPHRSKEILSLGIVVRALFVLFIVILKEKVATYYILIAIILAISDSLYWSSHELIYIDVTNDNNRKNFMAKRKIISKIMRIISPIILGTSIELYSFVKIAIYVFGLSIIQIIITLLIKVDKKLFEKTKYSFKGFMNTLKTKKLFKIKKYAYSGIFYGIIESTISTLIVIITIMTFKTSFNLGVLTTIFSLCSMLSLTLYNKYYNKKTAPKFLTICTMMIVFGVVGLLFDINKFTLIIYNFCYTTAFCIFDVVYNAKKGNLVKECVIEAYKEEYIGYTIVTVCIGRIIGYLLMLIFSLFNNIIYFKILLAVITLFAPIYSYVAIKLEK